MPDKKKIVEWVINIAIVIIGVMVCALLGKNIYQSYKGSVRLTIPGVDLKSHDRTLVFVLAKGCKYCKESGPFYRRIVEGLNGKKVHTVAILPEPTWESQRYLKGLGVSVGQVIQLPLRDLLGVSGTPTLLLLNQNGVIKRSWVGKLNADQEADFADYLGISIAEAGQQPIAEAGGVTQEVECFRARDLANVGSKNAHAGKIILLDLRTRPEYDAWHVSNAKNMPLDEIEARAKNELDPKAAIVVYLSPSPDYDSKNMFARDILNQRGFDNVRWLCGWIKDWKQEGITLYNKKDVIPHGFSR